MEFFQSILNKDYVWHTQKPRLAKTASQSLAEKYSTIYSNSLEIHDAISDEWRMVFTLLEISRNFDCAIQVDDDTGASFILQQCAFVIPDWMDPENTETRVWIFNGGIHFIPQSIELPTKPNCDTTDDIGSSVDFNRELFALCLPDVETVASNAVQTEIMNICGKRQELHSIVVDLPTSIAKCVQDPCILGTCIQALFDGMKATKAKFKDELQITKPEDLLIRCLLKLTKLQYALLRNIPYIPQTSNTGNALEIELAHKITAAVNLLTHPHPKITPVVEPFSVSEKFQELHDLLDPESNNTEILEEVYMAVYHNTFPNCTEQIAIITNDLSILLESHSGVSDSDDWMYVSESEISQLVAEYMQESPLEDDEKADQDFGCSSMRYAKISEKFVSFTGAESDVRGVALQGSDVDSSSDDEDELRPVQFDAEVYMQLLDSVGKQDFAEEDTELIELMESMDYELEQTSQIGKEFEMHGEEVDLDVNLVKNAVLGFEAQNGDAGPIGNLFTSMGFQF